MMTTPTPGEAVPEEEGECACHCHAPVYCPDCNKPVGPLEEPKSE
jgi:hypothetical protein